MDTRPVTPQPAVTAPATVPPTPVTNTPPVEPSKPEILSTTVVPPAQTSFTGLMIGSVIIAIIFGGIIGYTFAGMKYKPIIQENTVLIKEQQKKISDQTAAMQLQQETIESTVNRAAIADQLMKTQTATPTATPQ